MADFFLRNLMTLSLVISCPWIGLSQPESLKFEHLTVEHGLSSNEVLTIKQDREGFMWFGTFSGLNKYDGYTFTIFRPDPENPYYSLKDDHIFDIHEDRTGRLWVGAYGLYLLDKRTGKVIPYLADSTRFTYLNVSLTIYEDKNGALWISAGGGLNRFDPVTKQFTSYRSPELVPNFGIVQDDNGTFWMGSHSGLYQFDLKTRSFTLFPLKCLSNNYPSISALLLDAQGILWIGTSKDGLSYIDTKVKPALAKFYNPGNQVKKEVNRNGILEGKSGNLWLCTTEGLQYIDKNANRVITYTANPSAPGNLSSNNVYSVLEDKNGVLWVGTSNGVSKATAYTKPFSVRQISRTDKADLQSQNYVKAILEDKEGIVWLGTGKGLYQYNPNSQQTTFVPFTSSPIYAVHEDFSGKLWVGTKNGLYLFNRAAGTFKHYQCKIPVYFMDEDPFGKIWIPGGDETSGRAVMAVFDLKTLKFSYTEYELNDSNGLKDMYLNNIMASRTGDIWVATQSWGISRMNQKLGTFSYYLPNSGSSNSNLFGRFIWYLYEDNDGIIWAGTKMSGLYRFDPETKAFRSFTTHDGLPSNFIASIAGDKHGNLWLGTKKGLSRFNTRTNTFRNFDVSDGLPVDEFLVGSVYRGKDKLLFGTNKGFIIFYPDSIKENTSVPPVYLTNLKVLEKSRPIPDSLLELPFHENFLSFDFVALNYDSPEKSKYAYQLSGLDREWVYSGERRYASYPGLAPGRYTFRVKASNIDGIWNEQGTSLTIIIHPPWWKTWWFYLLCAIILLLIFYGIYYVRVSRLKELLNLRNKIAGDLHDDIGSTLSSITIMSEVAKQKTPQSSVLLEKIGFNAQQMQESMSDIVWAINPKNDRFEDVLKRMKMYAAEVLEAKGIVLQFSADESLYHLKLSMSQRKNLYLIFKEAITNLAKYSACQNTEVKISLQNKKCELLVQDDGNGFNHAHQTLGGNGLYNMQKRAGELDGVLKIVSLKGKGTSVHLQFKIT